MTCIVGIVDKESVYIGGDSTAGEVSQYFVCRRKDKKVFKRGPFVLGFTSSYRMGHLLMHSLKLPGLPAGRINHRWMVLHFVPAVRECLKEGGWLHKKDERETAGNFMVGVHGRLFEVESDLQVAEHISIGSMGCGYKFALGSLFSTAKTDMAIIERIRTALSAAEEFDAYVRRPFHIISTPNKP